MAKTVVGLFDTMEEAQGVVQDLIDSGFSRNDISLVANDAKGQYKDYKTTSRDVDGDGDDNNAGEGAGAGAIGGTVVGGVLGLLVGVGALAIPGIGPVVAAGTLATVLGSTALGAGIGAAAGGLIGALVGMGVPEEDARYYTEGVRRGGALVTVNASDDKADTAYDIIQRHGAVDIDERGADWKKSGWQGFDANAKPYSAQEIDTYRSQARPANTNISNRTNTQATPNRNINTQGGEAVLPVVEEELQVGKRQVDRGGVRVYSKVEEKPVQEQVSLREERVNVDRRPVDRAVTDADRTAFKEGTFEVRTTSEEAVVNKQARVVEEVAINKDVQQRNQTINDTVRRTDVQVEQLGSQPRTSATSYDTYDKDFRNHFNTTYANSGSTYDRYQPNYRYGYDLANDQRYANRNWSQIEPDVRRDWESRNPNSKWEQVKDSIRYAWDKATTGVKNAARDVTDQNYRNA